MTCKNCGGPLVMHVTTVHEVDENGQYFMTSQSPEHHLVCQTCGADHEYEELGSGDGGFHTVALTVNTDPKPVNTIRIGQRNGDIYCFEADKLTGVLVVNEDTSELCRYLIFGEGTWSERVKALDARIPRGESSLVFTNCGECGKEHEPREECP